jgi:hypothetical protein
MQAWPPLGRPLAPMLRTIFLCNIVAGALGAGTALALLGRRRGERPRQETGGSVAARPGPG